MRPGPARSGSSITWWKRSSSSASGIDRLAAGRAKRRRDGRRGPLRHRRLATDAHGPAPPLDRGFFGRAGGPFAVRLRRKVQALDFAIADALPARFPHGCRLRSDRRQAVRAEADRLAARLHDEEHFQQCVQAMERLVAGFTGVFPPITPRPGTTTPAMSRLTPEAGRESCPERRGDRAGPAHHAGSIHRLKERRLPQRELQGGEKQVPCLLGRVGGGRRPVAFGGREGGGHDRRGASR